jgi:hypothetical protein
MVCAPVKKDLNILALFDSNTHGRFCKMETEHLDYIICCCEALARQHYNFFGKFFVEPKYVSTASLKSLCPFVRDVGLMSLC